MTGSVEELSTALSTTTRPTVYSFPLSPGPHSILFIFEQYKYDYARAGEQDLLISDTGAVSTGNSTAIQLPIPANLTDNDNLIIENITQSALESFLGEYIATGASTLQNSDLNLPQALQAVGASLANIDLADALQSGIGSLNETLRSVLGANVGASSRDIAYLLRTVLPAGVSQAADRAFGSTVNPRASLAFEGVQLKIHTFSWPLSPHNKQESDQIRNIIKILKQNSLPSYQSLSTGGFKAYLRYPSIVQPYLIGINPEYFLKFKNSMIRSVSVEYGAGGLVSIAKGGKPANINLSIELVELDIHTAEDYGADSGGVVDEPVIPEAPSSAPSGPAGGPIPE